MDALLSQRLGQIEARFDQTLEHLETRFDEKLERVETRLLTEFLKWASPVEMPFRSHSAAIRAMDAQIESLTDRVKGLEDQH